MEEAVGLGREAEALGALFEALLLSHLAQVVLHLLLERAELIDVARLGELREEVHVDDADLSGFARLFELLDELVDFFELFLDGKGFGDRERFLASERVFGGELVDLVFVAETFDKRDKCAGEWGLVVAGGVPESLQIAELLGADGAVEGFAEFLGRLGFGGRRVKRLMCARLRALRVSYLARILCFRSRSMASRASMLGPRPAIWLGSMRIARASSSSVSSRRSPYMSMCSRAGETRSGGGCVGLGKRVGSYRWYVWMTPPRVLRLAII